MTLGIYKNSTNQLRTPIQNYAERLIGYMHNYLDMIDNREERISSKANEKAKIALRWYIFPNDKELEKDFKLIQEKIGNKTWESIHRHTKCIMQLVGRLAECVIVDHCANDKDINRVCINIAKFMPNIFYDYNEIDYDKYIAFSPSFKHIIYADENSGIFQQYNVPDYNPHHTSKDISWCSKENILSQLKVNIKQIDYLENAKLQIKATLNCNNLDLSDYYLTPVLCIDFNDDFNILTKRYPKHIIYSVRQIFPEMYAEMEIYFKILAAYATGLTSHINITDIEVYNDNRLAELFRTPVMNIVKEKELDIAGVIELANEFRKPILVST